jgi:peptidoglycan hydrolase-like protein with peptidoglycan-binding domain
VGAGLTPPAGSTAEDIMAVKASVKAIQRALNWHQATSSPIPTDGVFSQTTRTALIAFQQKQQPSINANMYIPASEHSPLGLVHKETSYALFMPIADRYALKYTIPRGLLRGITTLESNWDPGAIGYYTNSDFGLCQWNTTQAGVTKDNALDPFWALDSTAHMMQTRINAPDWGQNWIYVIAAHNAPTWAAEWAQGQLSASNPTDAPKLARVTGYTNGVLARVW